MAPILEILPPEIISSIIEILSRNYALNKGALKACSLTCSALLPYCRRHMFRFIRFYDAKDPEDRYSTHRFVQLITDNPAITDYILEVSYGIMDGEDIHCVSVASALDQLTSVQTLDLRGWDTCWSRLPSSTVSSLLRLMHLPTINILKLMFIDDFDLSDIVSCKNLQRFNVCQVGFRDFGKLDPSNMPVEPIRLQELTIDYVGHRVHPTPILEQRRPDGKPIFDLSYLSIVHFMIKARADLSWAQEILARTRRLETVDITGDSPSLTESAARLVCQSEPVLKTLEVFSLVSHIEVPPSDPLCGICEVLADMAGKNQIKNLKIRIAMYASTCPLGDEWGDLQRVLLAPGWPSLRQVNLQINCSDEKLQEDLKHVPAVQFSSLLNNNSFKFNFQVFGPQDI